MKISVKVDGAKVIASVDKMPADMRRAVKIAVEEACEEIVKTAQDKCPVDTGDLNGDIKSAVVDNDATIIGRVGTNIDYAPYVHEGTGVYAKNGKGRQRPWSYTNSKGEVVWTKGSKPRPFLQEAMDEHRGSALRYIAEVIKRCLKQS